MDFTVFSYCNLLDTLQGQGFLFLTVEELEATNINIKKCIILRHDVDALPKNSLVFAKKQADKGIRGTYYFRVLSQTFDPKIIKEIHSLGHEVGYHYEDMNLCAKRGLRYEEELLSNIAIKSFKNNLEKLRKLVPVSTICMHGSPWNKWDNRLLWKYNDYHDFGITIEPYFDINFGEVLYLTDTGRRWDGGLVSIRDKAQGSGLRAQDKNSFDDWKVKPQPASLMNMMQESIDFQNKYKFRSTSEIIRAAERGELPDKILVTFHPQRWTNKSLPWMKELVWQNVKNVGKYFLIKVRS